MANDLIKFNAGSLDIGVDTFNPDFTAALALTIETANITGGINQGVGVRYGITPIPGQSDNEVPLAAGDRTNGIMRSEVAADVVTNKKGLTNRTRAFRLIPLKLRIANPYDPVTGIQTFTTSYESILFLVCGDASHFDVVYQARCDDQNNSQFNYTYSPLIQQGFEHSYVFPTTKLAAGYMSEFSIDYQMGSSAAIAHTAEILSYSSSRYYISAASFTKPSKKVPMQWMIGHFPGGSNFGDATHAPDVELFSCAMGNIVGGAGIPSSVIYDEMEPTSRGINIYTLNSSQIFNILYSYNTTLQSIINPGIIDLATETPNIKFASGGVSGTKLTSGTSYSSNVLALINDPGMYTDSAYNAVFIAGSSPMAIITQEWTKTGTPRQYIDLSNDILRPHTIDLANSHISLVYKEAGYAKNTCFWAWPEFIRGTAMATATGGAILGGPDSGLLRKNTVYEITYSHYNKRIDAESNVGVPVKVQTGSDDNICIGLSASVGATETQAYTMGQSYVAAAAVHPPVWWNFTLGGANIGLDVNHFVNFTELRFYYREEGAFEWLPAGSFDAAEYWYRPNPQFALICVSAVAALPGGQPGGFNDYSPLVKQQYNSVLVYKNRTFWFSAKSLNFSYENNPLAYALRNIITVQTGEFLGGIVHNYPGQAQQTSRLIVAATDAIYVGRFTENPSLVPVQVSPDSVGTFPLDGSDFVFDLWTTITSFSARSMVVAEGYLYYWGPQGIFRDNGTENPDRISQPLEPNIFSLYDKTKTAEIFCVYNNQTREILWFYTPPDDPDKTHCIIYNLTDQAFLFGQFNCKVDDASQISLTGDNSGTFGQQRTFISVRASHSATVQRMFFFDYLNRSGDMTTGKELMVKSISTPSVGVRRLTMAAGFDPANISAISLGSNICLQQLAKYWPATTGTDMIATVQAVSSGSGYVDIILPDDATLDSSATLDYSNFFPAMQSEKTTRGLHGIDWVLDGKYWCPNGINNFFRWLFVYLFFKYSTLPKNIKNQFQIGYRTPSGGGMISDTITMVDNSDSNFQVYHGLRQGGGLNRQGVIEGGLNSQGQAIKIRLSGVHIGEEWVLQYIEAHCSEDKGNNLKQYQG